MAPIISIGVGFDTTRYQKEEFEMMTKQAELKKQAYFQSRRQIVLNLCGYKGAEQPSMNSCQCVETNTSGHLTALARGYEMDAEPGGWHYKSVHYQNAESSGPYVRSLQQTTFCSQIVPQVIYDKVYIVLPILFRTFFPVAGESGHTAADLRHKAP